MEYAASKNSSLTEVVVRLLTELQAVEARKLNPTEADQV